MSWRRGSRACWIRWGSWCNTAEQPPPKTHQSHQKRTALGATGGQCLRDLSGRPSFLQTSAPKKDFVGAALGSPASSPICEHLLAFADCTYATLFNMDTRSPSQYPFRESTMPARGQMARWPKKVFAPPETAPKSEIPPPGALVINTVSIQYGESAHFSCTFVRSACTKLVLIVYSASTFLYFSHTLLQVRRRLPSLCTPPRSMSPQPNFGQALHDSTIIEFVGCCEPSHDSRASGVRHDATPNNQR